MGLETKRINDNSKAPLTRFIPGEGTVVYEEGDAVRLIDSHQEASEIATLFPQHAEALYIFELVAHGDEQPTHHRTKTNGVVGHHDVPAYFVNSMEPLLYNPPTASVPFKEMNGYLDAVVYDPDTESIDPSLDAVKNAAVEMSRKYLSFISSTLKKIEERSENRLEPGDREFIIEATNYLASTLQILVEELAQIKSLDIFEPNHRGIELQELRQTILDQLSQALGLFERTGANFDKNVLLCLEDYVTEMLQESGTQRREIFKSIFVRSLVAMGDEDEEGDPTDNIKSERLESVERGSFGHQDNTLITEIVHDLVIAETNIDEALLEKLISKWQLANQSSIDERLKQRFFYLGKAVIKNIDAIKHLQGIDASAPAELMDRFGIANYSIIPLEVLRAQYEHRDDKELKYGTASIIGQDEGVFRILPSALATAFADLQALGIGLRVVEGETGLGVTKRIIQLDNEYGADNKNAMEFLLVFSHAGENYLGDITSSELEQSRSLIKRLLEDKGGPEKPGRRILTEKAPLGLIACSTDSGGEDKRDFADRTREISGHPVVAMPTDGYPKEIHFKLKEDSSLDIIVIWSTGGPWQITQFSTQSGESVV